MSYNIAGVDENGKLHPDVLPDEGLADKVTQEGPFRDELVTSIEVNLESAARPLQVDVDALTAIPADQPLITQTFEGSGQAVHPDVIYFPRGWNGFRYWMGMTPYPNGLESVESPSILASNDGTTWEVPPGLVNPVVPGFVPDPDLTYEPESGRLYCVYAGVGRKWSIDGVTWSSSRQIIETLNEVSPAVIRRGQRDYWMWTVKKGSGGAPHEIRLYRGPSLDGPDGWTAATTCTIQSPTGFTPWHIDVQEYGGTFVALVSFCVIGTNGINAVLYAATSGDGVSWKRGADALLRPRPGYWDGTHIYRSSLVASAPGSGEIADIWYSARSEDGQWRIGRTSLRWTDPEIAARAPLSEVARHRAPVEVVEPSPNLLEGVSTSLLELSGTPPVPSGWSDVLTATDKAVDVARRAFTFRNNGGGTISVVVPVEAGEEYTFSVETESEADTTNLAIIWRGTAGATLSSVSNASPVTGRKLRRSVSGIAPAEALTARFQIGARTSVQSPVGTRYWWREAKLEIGSVATAYSGPGFDLEASRPIEVFTSLTEEGRTRVGGIGRFGEVVLPSFATGMRPLPSSVTVGSVVFDTTLGKPIWSVGDEWRDAAGAAV